MTEESNYKRSSEIYHEILNQLLILYRQQNPHDYKLNKKIDSLETELKIFHSYIKVVRGDTPKSDSDRYYNSSTEKAKDNLEQLKRLLLDGNKSNLRESNNFNFYLNLFEKILNQYNGTLIKKESQTRWLLSRKSYSQKKYLKEAMLFYRNVLPEMGEKLANLIEINKEKTIYFFSHKKVREICFNSDFYKQPFVFVQDHKNIMTRWTLIHEMGHQYDILESKKLTSLSELAPTLTEMLSNDYFSITKKSQLEIKVLKKYRLNLTMSLINDLYFQMRGLLHLEDQGNSMFDVKEIERMFTELNVSKEQRNHFLLNPFRGFNYSLSYLLALKYQTLFYTNDSMVREKLELIRSNEYKLYDYMYQYKKDIGKNVEDYIDITLELQDIDLYLENNYEKVLK